jgi:hypothetical protein
MDAYNSRTLEAAEDHEFKVTLRYMIARLYLKKQNKKIKTNNPSLQIISDY